MDSCIILQDSHRAHPSHPMTENRQVHIRRSVAFRRLAKVLREDIQAGRYVPGELMPSRRALAQTHDVTPNTVNKAIHELMEQGLLEATERLGTRVAKVIAHGAGAPVAGRQPIAHTGATTGLVAVLVTTDIPLESSLSQGRTNDVWTSTIARHLEIGLARGGARTSYHRVYHDALPTPQAAVAAALATKPSAVALINIYGYAGWAEALREIPETGPETLVLTSMPMSCPNAQLSYDQTQFGYLAGSHLVANGYRRLVILRPFVEPWLEQRIAGVKHAAKHAGRTVSCTVVSPATMLIADTLQQASPVALTVALAPLLADWQPAEDGTTALVVPSDRLGLALLPILRAAGHEPGRNFGIIGFDDIAEGRAAGLSTVRPPLEAMGDRAATLLLEAMRGPLTRTLETLTPFLLPRRSTDFASAQGLRPMLFS